MHSEEYPDQEQLNNDIVLYDDLYKTFNKRIIVAGSRSFNDYLLFEKQMLEYLSGLDEKPLFYTGMAKKGPDALIVNFCLKHEYKYLEHPANWDSYGKGAGFIRNRHMASTATHLIAFWDKESSGTKDMIEVAKEHSLNVIVFDVDKDDEDTYFLATYQISQWRRIKPLGYKMVDITVKSGILPFSPEYQWVMDVKNSIITPEEYTGLYLQKLANSRVNNKDYWERLKAYKRMAFGCYCNPGEFCHRHLFIKEVADYLQANDLSIKIIGEL